MIKGAVALLQGFLIGLANIIPGVSGGTLALVLGIYRRLIRAVRGVDAAFVRVCLEALTLRRPAWLALRQALTRIDAGFLALIGCGALAAIVSTSRLMEYLLNRYHEESYAFFFGLVLASILFPLRYLTRRSSRELVAFLAAACLTVALTAGVNEDDRIRAAEVKQAAAAETGAQAAAEADGGIVSLETPGTMGLVVVFLSAALAISAMVLPGVSGSFVLLLLGVYFDVLTAVNDRQIVVLGVFALGGGAGLLLFARIMNTLLERYFDPTMAFMIGLMAGSLFALWPFKRVVVVGDETLYLGNVVPDTVSGEVVSSIVCGLIGAGLVLAFYLYERRRPAPADLLGA